MKKKFFLFAFVSLSISAFAQDAPTHTAFQKKIYLTEVGLVGGINYHSFIYENPEPIAEFDGKIGYRFGINTVWQIQRVRISIGLVTERKGRVYTIPVTYFDDQSNPMSGTLRDRLNLNYLVLPTNLNFQILKSGKLSVDVGFYLGYLLKATSITDFSWQISEFTDATAGYKSIDFGVNVGVTFGLIQISDLYKIGIGPYASIGLTPNDTAPANRNFSCGLTLSLIKSKI